MVESLALFQNDKVPSIYDVPTQVLQTKVLCHFSSKELFMLRGVCGDWSDSIKIIWCHIVKEEMLEQVHSLDLLYEKETTAKLLEFKIRYLVSYATLMRNYFLHMNFEEIVQDLFYREDQRGKQILLIACMIVAPQSLDYPSEFSQITEQHIREASHYMLTTQFKQQFAQMCQMETIPDVSLGQMKVIKSEFIENIITPDVIDQLGNAARLLNSWIDGALEYTILKHEVLVLRLKNNKVHEKIKYISALWPKKKQFIEGAYKILLFTKSQRLQINCVMNALRQRGLFEFMDFKDAVNRVLKKWYEQRIQEETERNKKLRELHDNLTKMKILREEEQIRQQQLEIDKQGQKKDDPVVESQQLEVEQDIKDRKEKLEHEMEQLKQEIQKTNEQIEETKEQIIQKKQEQEQAPIEEVKVESKQIEESNDLQEVQSLSVQTETQTEPANQQQEEEVKQSEQIDTQVAQESQQQQQVNQNLFSSQLLSQILQVGTLFTQKALQDENEEQDDDEEFDHYENYISPEELRQEIYENILKRRIFNADRMEKVEKVLLNMELIPKDQIYCSQVMLEEFKNKIFAENGSLLLKIYEQVNLDKEELWFEIYRSISNQSAESQELERKKEKRIERRRRRLLKIQHDLKIKRLRELEEDFQRRRQINAQRGTRRSGSEGRYNEPSQTPRRGRRSSQRRYEHYHPDNNQNSTQAQVQASLPNVIVGIAALRYLLDTALQAAQRRQDHQNSLVQQINQAQNAINDLQDMAVQTESVNEALLQQAMELENQQQQLQQLNNQQEVQHQDQDQDQDENEDENV